MISFLLQTSLCLLMVLWVIPVSGKTYDSEKWAEASNYFGSKLYHKLKRDPRGNLIFSPLSLSIAFGMIFHGTGGQASTELYSVLGYEKAGLSKDKVKVSSAARTLVQIITSSDYEMVVANKILFADSFDVKADYMTNMKDFYSSEIEKVNFAKDSAAIVQRVNGWVESHTKGKIKSLVDKIEASTLTFVLNAVYFKGFWKNPFLKTLVKPFYNDGHRETLVTMMNLKRWLGYSSFGTYRAVEIPYKGDAALLVLLPKENEGLSTLESEFRYSDLLDSTRSALRENLVNLTLPKFDLDYSYSGDLVDALKQLGMERLFGNEADFSGISASNGMKISRVVHKATVSVDEEGTVATAVTGIVGHPVSFQLGTPPPVVQFNVNHPFMFAIIEKRTGMAMFLGRVSNLPSV